MFLFSCLVHFCTKLSHNGIHRSICI
jgi:hypothetical protein